MRIEVRFEMDTETITRQALREMLKNPVMLEHLDQLIERARTELADLRCRVHNQPPYITVTVLTTNEIAVDIVGCCEALVQAAKLRFDRGLVQTAYFQPGMRLIVQVEGDQEPLVFDFFQIDTLVIGRSAPETDDAPEIDLAPYGAFDRGISRRHALLFWRNGTLHIMDDDSANGTFLNGRRLPPREPTIIRNHDEIALGGLALTVMLEY
ncbi:MAG: FHA domain-containing protein [Anaerolineae bacterium]|nr:FHA domain-containing protein [Anaerolineae bacterium]